MLSRSEASPGAFGRSFHTLLTSSHPLLASSHPILASCHPLLVHSHSLLAHSHSVIHYLLIPYSLIPPSLILKDRLTLGIVLHRHAFLIVKFRFRLAREVEARLN